MSRIPLLLLLRLELLLPVPWLERVLPALRSRVGNSDARELRTHLLAHTQGNFITLVVPVSRGSGGSFVARNLAAAMAFDEAKIANRLIVVGDGAEALDYLFGTGGHAGRKAEDLPAVVLLDLKLPRIDGLEVLRRIRADARTAVLPVVVLTTSR